MDRTAPHTLADSIAAAYDWWREAGVDLAYYDETQRWLPPVDGAQAESVLKTEIPAEAPAKLGGHRANWPETLDRFASWWASNPTLDAGPPATRVPPRGPHGAALMVIVPLPEADDSEVLLSGREGRLIASVTRAMGFAAHDVYLASALPRFVSLPDWTSLAADGLGEILRHHVSLVEPERLLVLGRDILPLLGHASAQPTPVVSEVEILSRKLPVLSSFAPGRLLDHPRLRAELWRQWLDWTGTEQ